MRADVVCFQAPFGSDHYRQSLKLREAVLRKPLGLALAEEDFAGDAHAHHFCALQKDTVVSYLQLESGGGSTVKLRQMAVAAERRGQDIGTALIRSAEAWAREQGFLAVFCHARGTARGFYDKMGYGIEGAPFDENTIPHIRMCKSLTP
jgi:predicted GNAT family N-acyltransferase